MKISLLVEGSTTELAEAIQVLHDLENRKLTVVERDPNAPIFSISGSEGKTLLSVSDPVEADKKAVKADKKKAETVKPAVEPVKEVDPDPAPVQVEKQAEVVAPAEPEEKLQIEQIRAVFNPVAQAKRAEAVALLAKYGAKGLTEFYKNSTAEQHREFFEALKGLL